MKRVFLSFTTKQINTYHACPHSPRRQEHLLRSKDPNTGVLQHLLQLISGSIRSLLHTMCLPVPEESSDNSESAATHPESVATHTDIVNLGSLDCTRSARPNPANPACCCYQPRTRNQHQKTNKCLRDLHSPNYKETKTIPLPTTDNRAQAPHTTPHTAPPPEPRSRKKSFQLKQTVQNRSALLLRTCQSQCMALTHWINFPSSSFDPFSSAIGGLWNCYDGRTDGGIRIKEQGQLRNSSQPTHNGYEKPANA